MKLSTKQIKQIIIEELRELLNEGMLSSFEDFPPEIQELYKAGWPEELQASREVWEETAYVALLKDQERFDMYIKGSGSIGTPEKYFEYQFGQPVTRIIMNLTHQMYDIISDELITDMIIDDWNHAVDYFEKTEEGIEIVSYMEGLVYFAFDVASGKLPESPYSSKLTTLAKSSKDGMVQAYNLYQTLSS